MVLPRWWSEQRLGVAFEASLATVPAWAPIGQDAAEYWKNLAGDPSDRTADGPLAEVLAHHQERWAHVARYDDFASLLTFIDFDPEDWAQLAVEAGAGFCVHTAKHRDGWCWWAAPNTTRTLLDDGPRRDVHAEFAAACERNGLVFGSNFSLTDWGDPAANFDDRNGSTSDVVTDQLRDLVEHHHTAALFGIGRHHHGSSGDPPPPRPPDTPPGSTPRRSLLRLLHDLDPELVVDDAWLTPAERANGTRDTVVRTFVHQPPPGVLHTPWMLRHPIGSGSGFNRADHAGRCLSAPDIVALYTEVLAKGGHLLLGVGPTADGTIPDVHAAPLRTAGRWITPLSGLFEVAQPWERWGGAQHRWLAVGDRLIGIDLTGTGRFDGVDPRRWRITDVQLVADAGSLSQLRRSGVDRSELERAAGVGAPLVFRHDSDGRVDVDLGPIRRRLHLHLDDARSSIRALMFALTVEPIEAPIELFEPTPAASRPLAPLLADAEPGDIVRLGDGLYHGPAEIPAGVVVRGLGPGRTAVDGDGGAALTLGRGARVEHLSIVGCGDRSDGRVTAVRLCGNGSAVLGVQADGHVELAADGCVVRASSAHGVFGADIRDAKVSRCEFAGDGWDIGVEFTGGEGHVVESCRFDGHLVGISFEHTIGTAVRGNVITSRRWGVRLRRTERTHVNGNRIDHTSRAVDVDGGHGAIVDGNAVSDSDSGCVVQAGASECIVSGNHWERCRVGLLGWNVTDVHDVDNHTVQLDEYARMVSDVG